jgi:hypothetical protein
MSRATPEEAFAEARAAMERGDWEGVYACLDAETLLRIAENGLGRLLAGGPATEALLAGLCREHAVPDEMVVTLRARLQRLAESARVVLSPDVRSDPRAMVEASLRHKGVVDEYRASLKSTLKAVPELARFTAALERTLRAESGGGSMSTRLFVGEALEQVSITGAKAWATRRSADGHVEDVGFARKRDGWHIRPLAKRPGAGRG